MRFEATTSYLAFAGVQLSQAAEIDEVHGPLGPPNRIVSAGGKAPPGRRNNQFHFYDDLGMSFVEHHFTRRVMEARFFLAPSALTARPLQNFTGTLALGGLPVYAGMLAEALERSSVRFKWQLAGVWRDDENGAVSLSLDFMGKKLPSGRRSKNRELVHVSVGLEHDPWSPPRPPA